MFFLVNIFYGEVSLPKYLSGMSSGIRTNNKRTQLAGKYMNEKSIATEYVDVVTIVRLPALLPIKAGTIRHPGYTASYILMIAKSRHDIVRRS